MSIEISPQEIANYKGLFPEKYHDVLKKAEFQRCVGAPFEIVFKTHEDFNQFFLLWEKEDFPAKKFPNEFSVGIMATCPSCSNLQMAGGMDFAIMELNARNVKLAFEKGEEPINVCVACLMETIFSGNISEYIKETKRQLKVIKGGLKE